MTRAACWRPSKLAMIDLAPHHLETVQRILSEHVPDAEVRAFGSRATWEAQEHSDLDLAIDCGSRADPSAIARLKEAFEESTLPIRVDVLDWHTVSDSFRKVIERSNTVLRGGSIPATVDNRTEMILGDVCTKIGSGATPRGGKETYVLDGPYALIRSQNVHNTGFSDDGLAFISQEQAEALQNVEVLHDDVLLNITGDSVARVCQVDPLVLPARVNQHVAIIRPDPSKLDPEYLRYYLASPEAQTTLLSWASSGGTRNALTKKMIESFVLHAPVDLSEQRATARSLGTLDHKIELNRRMSQTLEEMARTLFRSWFIDFDPVHAKAEGRPSGLPPDLDEAFPDSFESSVLGEIPSGWKVTSLGDVVELAYGKALRAQDRQYGEVPVYGSNGQIGWHDEHLVTGPGIVIGRKGNPGIVTWSHSKFYPIDTAFYVVPRDILIGLHFLYFDITTTGSSIYCCRLRGPRIEPTPRVHEFADRAAPASCSPL